MIKTKRTLTLVLAVIMCFSLIPVNTSNAASTNYSLTITHTGLSSLDDLKDASGNIVAPSGTNVTATGLVSIVNNIDDGTEYIYRFNGGSYYDKIVAGNNPNRHYLDSIVIKMGDAAVLDSRVAYPEGFPTQNTGNAGAVIGGSSNNVWIQTGAGNTGVRFNKIKPSGNISAEFNWHVDADPNASKYAITVIDGANGSVGSRFLENNGETAEWRLTATPNPGYMLDYWEWTDKENDWANAERIENDLFENDKATITETITQDRWYRAVFRPWQFIMPGNAVLSWSGSIPWGLEGRVAAYGSPIPVSQTIRSGKPAILIFQFGWPCEINGVRDLGASPDSSGISVSFYAGDCTEDESAAPFAVCPLTGSSQGTISASTGKYRTYIEALPNAAGITVEVKTATGMSVKKYYPLTIEQDPFEAIRNQKLADLKQYYTEHFAETPQDTKNSNTGHMDFNRIEERRAEYDSLSAVRILLRRAYENAVPAIQLDAGDEAAINAAYDAAIARFDEYLELNEQIKAGKGEAYKDIKEKDVIRVLFYQNPTVDPPSFAYVPSNSVVRDALEAAMENYSPGKWGIYGGAFITSMGYNLGDGKVEAGGNSSQIVYSQNHLYALGVGSQTMTDRDVLSFGGTIEPNQYPDLKKLPDKTDLVWALGTLAENHDLSELNENPAFTDAMKITKGFGVFLYDGGADGRNVYPDNLATAQAAVDKALAGLGEAYPEDNLVRLNLPPEVLAVMKLINAIGDVTPESGDAIAKALAAYNALSPEDQKQVPNYKTLAAAKAGFEFLSSPSGQASDVLKRALPALQESYNANPATGSIGGEWPVLGIARGGKADSDTEIKYLSRLSALLVDKGLDEIGAGKYTEYARIALALSSLGIDAQTYSYAGTGYDFISKLTDFDKVTRQGINGAIFALLALDSKPYAPGSTEIRDRYIDYILAGQHDDGGWALGDAKNEASDPDVTAMALQALSNYKDLKDVSTAIPKGLDALKKMQDKIYGGFYSYRAYNSESAAQVIVALTALGIDPTGSEWTVGDGKNPVSALLAFYDTSSAMFRHVLNGGADQMATEQSVYALVALDRFNMHAGPLYDMSDAFGAQSGGDAASKAGLRDAIAAASALNESDYTAESWSDLQGVLTAAKTVNSDIGAAQEAVDSARGALLSAIGRLEAVDASAAGLSVLNAAVNIAEALDGKEYADWTKVTAALSAAKGIEAGAEQLKIDDASAKLLDALVGLKRAPNTALLDAAIDASEDLNADDYTSDSWNALREARTAAGGAYTVQDDVNLVAQELVSSVNDLKAAEAGGDKEYTAVKAVLKAIRAALEQNKDNYTSETWNTLTAATEKSELASALCGLELKNGLNDFALRKILGEADSLAQSDYTESSYGKLAEALSAKLKLTQGIYTEQKEIDNDAAAILTAMKNLELSVSPGAEQVNKTLLKALIDHAKTLREARYTPETWSVFSVALAGANAVYANGEAVQEAVGTAKDELLGAIGQLRIAAGVVDVDKVELNDEITEALAITNMGVGYTTTSWKSFQAALAYAQEISAKEEASQNEVNSASRDLRIAMKGLTEYNPNEPDDNLPDSPTGEYAWISVTDTNAKAGQTKIYYPNTKLELRLGETAFSILQRTGLTLRTSTHPKYAGIYVEAINGFGEFDDGPLSGWMYRVNGDFPNFSSSLYSLSDGDKVEWVYTRDLGKDVGGGWSSGSGAAEADRTVAPTAAVRDGKASVSLGLSDMTDAIGNAKGGGDEIIIAPKTGGTVSSMEITLKNDALNAIANQTNCPLTIQTPVGNMTIPSSALASIASQAGSTVTVTIESVDKTTLTKAQQKLVGGNQVFDISITSGGKNINSFDGKSITISLPYTLKVGETADGVSVWYLNDKSELEKIACKYDKAAGLATFATNHLSRYLVGYSKAWQNPFADVKSTDWFYGAVEYASMNGLFNGTTATAFSPNAQMTRAMLVTVLYRLEGSPAVKDATARAAEAGGVAVAGSGVTADQAGTSAFVDVKDGQWYTDAVAWANANGIVAGIGNGLFGTNSNVTREQMATILYNYSNYKGYDIAIPADAGIEGFNDAAAVSSWAQTPMKWANSEKLVNGRTDTTLAPGGGATRAEVATILKRFAEGVVK